MTAASHRPTNPTYTTLISAGQLAALLDADAPVRLFDCSFDLMDAAAGARQFEQAHLPRARHAHLDHHLSDKSGNPGAASGGRHPLPSREAFAAWLESIGFSSAHQAVVYDRQGANYCGRLWWMLKWCGHEAVAVLDGGLDAWTAEGGPIETGPAKAWPQPDTGFGLKPPLAKLVGATDVNAGLGRPGQTVLDARAAARFRGEVEPLDPVAGHIPGALNRPFTQNIGPDGRFKPAAVLRAEFDLLLAGHGAQGVVHHCGSGVSAIPNLLAMEVAGLGRGALFAGSWSEWCNTPGLPCARIA